MSDRRESIIVRDGNGEDFNFIMATWLKGLRYGNEWFHEIEPSVYFEVYHTAIQSILARPGCQVKVACLKDDPNVIFGYAVFNGDRLDWVHVKKSFRKIGLARSLVPPTIKSVSHLTKQGLSIKREKMPAVTFNPFIP
jgi:hypothetical protein